MHAVKIFRALVCFSVLMPVFASAAKVDVYKEFEAKISFLEKNLAKEKDINKRYDIFLKTFKDISELRKAHARQTEDKEISMGFFTDALISLPAKKDFDPKKCSEYVMEVESAARSYDPDHKEDYADRALKITKLICK